MPMNQFSSHSPDSLGLSGKDELLVFALTFLTSTWYIKNPFLKAKINEVRTCEHETVRLSDANVPVGGVLWCPAIRTRTKWNFGRNPEQPSFGTEASDTSIDTLLYWWECLCFCVSTLILRRSFQSEVEQTGASSQFYDKFSEYSSHFREDCFRL